jgi:catechol 2,3-dioxygenase-like lactoylglutathione lyase family enzyme
MLTAIDHVIVAVADLDAATRATSTLLGRGASWRGHHPAFGTANTLFRADNTYLELLAPIGPGPLADMLRERLGREGEGLAGFVFGTADADACARTLRARGLPASDPEPGLGRDDESGAFRTWRNVWLPRGATRGVWTFAIEHTSPADTLPLATPGPEPSACVHALDHVVVASGDPDASSTLYGDTLGLRLALDRSFPERGLRILFFRVGGVTVEVVGRLASPPDAARGAQTDADLSRAPGAGTDRLSGLAWRVGDVDSARARLAQAGVDVSDVRRGHKPGTRVCTVRSGTCGVPTLLIAPDPAASDGGVR